MKDKLIVLCANMLKAQDTITSIVEDGAYTGTINKISIDLTNGTSIIFVPEDEKIIFGMDTNALNMSYGYSICSLERFEKVLNKIQKERGDNDGI